MTAENNKLTTVSQEGTLTSKVPNIMDYILIVVR